MMKKWLLYSLYVLLFAFLGFSREFLFVNINNKLYQLYYGHSNLPLPNILSFLNNFEYTTIYYSKYPLTIFYYLAYCALTYFVVKNICLNKAFSRWIIYLYAILLIIAGITMAFNYLINNTLSGNEYLFSRWLMGIAQSPLIAFFMIASHKLYTKLNTNTN